MSPYDLNNTGVVHLTNGNFAKAHEAFRCALKSIATLVQDNDTNRSESGARTDTTSSSTLCVASSMPSFLTCDNGLTIHSQGIRVDASLDRSDYENVTMLSSVVVFNIALTYHLNGLAEMDQKVLYRTKALYRQCYRLLGGVIHDGGLHTGSNATLDLLSMALLNNLAHIEIEFCDLHEADVMFQRLVRYALLVQSRSYSDERLSVWMNGQALLFLRNTALCSLSSLCVAPAA